MTVVKPLPHALGFGENIQWTAAQEKQMMKDVPWTATDDGEEQAHDENKPGDSSEAENFVARTYLQYLWLPESIMPLPGLVHALRRITPTNPTAPHPLHALLDPLLLTARAAAHKYNAELAAILAAGGGAGEAEEAMMWFAYEHERHEQLNGPSRGQAGANSGADMDPTADPDAQWQARWLNRMERRECVAHPVSLQLLLITRLFAIFVRSFVSSSLHPSFVRSSLMHRSPLISSVTHPFICSLARSSSSAQLPAVPRAQIQILLYLLKLSLPGPAPLASPVASPAKRHAAAMRDAASSVRDGPSPRKRRRVQGGGAASRADAPPSSRVDAPPSSRAGATLSDSTRAPSSPPASPRMSRRQPAPPSPLAPEVYLEAFMDKLSMWQLVRGLGADGDGALREAASLPAGLRARADKRGSTRAGLSGTGKAGAARKTALARPAFFGTEPDDERDWIQVFCEDVVEPLFQTQLPDLCALLRSKVFPHSPFSDGESEGEGSGGGGGGRVGSGGSSEVVDDPFGGGFDDALDARRHRSQSVDDPFDAALDDPFDAYTNRARSRAARAAGAGVKRKREIDREVSMSRILRPARGGEAEARAGGAGVRSRDGTPGSRGLTPGSRGLTPMEEKEKAKEREKEKKERELGAMDPVPGPTTAGASVGEAATTTRHPPLECNGGLASSASRKGAPTALTITIPALDSLRRRSWKAQATAIQPPVNPTRPHAHAQEPAKKARGRPRGSTNKRKDGVPASIAASSKAQSRVNAIASSSVATPESASAPASPSRRGRPKRKPGYTSADGAPRKKKRLTPAAPSVCLDGEPHWIPSRLGAARTMPSELDSLGCEEGLRPRVWASDKADLHAVLPELFGTRAGGTPISSTADYMPVVVLDEASVRVERNERDPLSCVLSISRKFSCRKPVAGMNVAQATEVLKPPNLRCAPFKGVEGSSGNFSTSADTFAAQASPPSLETFSRASLQPMIVNKPLETSAETAVDDPDGPCLVDYSSSSEEPSSPAHESPEPSLGPIVLTPAPEALNAPWRLISPPPSSRWLFPPTVLPPDPPMRHTPELQAPVVLPSDVDALAQAHQLHYPVLLVASRATLATIWHVLVPEAYAYCFLGLFHVTDMQGAIADGTPLITSEQNGCAIAEYCWQVTMRWIGGGESFLAQDDVMRPWWMSRGAKQLSSPPPQHIPVDKPIATSSSNRPDPPPGSMASATREWTSYLPPAAMTVFPSDGTYESSITFTQDRGICPASYPSSATQCLSDNALPSGWCCRRCGKINLQLSMRQRACTSAACAGLTGASKVGYALQVDDVRDPRDTLPLALPVSAYPSDAQAFVAEAEDGVRIVEVRERRARVSRCSGSGASKASDGAMVLEPGIRTATMDDESDAGDCATVFATHVFTCNMRALQADADQLFVDVQRYADLRRTKVTDNLFRCELPVASISPTGIVGEEVPTRSEAHSVTELSQRLHDYLLSRTYDYAEDSTLSVRRLLCVAGIGAGSRKVG
ncbi:hypothetical protein HDZ31DRAFT_83739 [Schizophyllum fasciatum]